MERIVLAGGCFWCVEASFRLLDGIKRVVSGYAGGHTARPTYEHVSTGETGHAEAVEITFDSKFVSIEKLLDVFFMIHDPAQRNRQGADVGSQYRSAIFYTSKKQKKRVNRYMENLESSGVFPKIVTQIEKLDSFWPAEDYHQNYFAKHPEQAYCQFVIRPKIERVRMLE